MYSQVEGVITIRMCRRVINLSSVDSRSHSKGHGLSVYFAQTKLLINNLLFFGDCFYQLLKYLREDEYLLRKGRHSFMLSIAASRMRNDDVTTDHALSPQSVLTSPIRSHLSTAGDAICRYPSVYYCKSVQEMYPSPIDRFLV